MVAAAQSKTPLANGVRRCLVDGCCASRVGTAAGLTVLEGDLRPRFARWQAFKQAIGELALAA
jgi:hypothetical protein